MSKVSCVNVMAFTDLDSLPRGERALSLLDLEAVLPLCVRTCPLARLSSVWLVSTLEVLIWKTLTFNQEKNVLGSLPYPGRVLSYFTASLCTTSTASPAHHCLLDICHGGAYSTSFV